MADANTSFEAIAALLAKVRQGMDDASKTPEERASLKQANDALVMALGEIALKDYSNAADAVASAASNLKTVMAEASTEADNIVSGIKQIEGAPGDFLQHISPPQPTQDPKPEKVGDANPKPSQTRADITDAGYKLLRQWEGCILFAYDDANEKRILPGQHIAGTLTIGYGHTGHDVTPGLTWTQAQADAAMHADILAVIKQISPMIHAQLSDNQFSAFVCFAFNIGTEGFRTSGALAKANAGSLQDVPAHMALWNKTRINGVLVVSPGLANRRAAEITLWKTP